VHPTASQIACALARVPGSAMDGSEQVYVADAAGSGKARGTQPKLTEFYPNKKARQHHGYVAADAQLGEKAPRAQRKMKQAPAPVEENGHDSKDSMSDSGGCPVSEGRGRSFCRVCARVRVLELPCAPAVLSLASSRCSGPLETSLEWVLRVREEDGARGTASRPPPGG